MLLAVSILACLGLACGSRGGVSNPPGPTAGELVAEGWTLFTQGDIAGARDRFAEAEIADPNLAAAPLGLGWSLLRLEQLGAAIDALERAEARGEDSADLHAALAIASRDDSPVDWRRCLAAADAALLRSPDYRFAYDASFDWRDLRLLAGQSAFALGDHERARTEVILLGGPELDPESPGFVAALLQALDALRT